MSKLTTNTLSNNTSNTDASQNEETNLNASKLNASAEHSQNKIVANSSYSSPSAVNSVSKARTSMSDKKKMGHREVKDGVVHYKKVPTDELKKSIQFGVVHSVSFSSKYPDRDILIQDFTEVVTIQFPKVGSASTPPHEYSDFKLKVYAPYGFKYLRRKCNLDEIDFMSSIGETELTEISNPGASGSVFYKTSNDKYILKTVQYQEAEFLKTLLAGFLLGLLQNLIDKKYSLLPTIYGLYCYQKSELASRIMSDKTNIRVVIMNNILPSDIPIHEKYDLKGSLYKRKASSQERMKTCPTFKDLDFLEEHPEGLVLDERYYDNIMASLKRDCLILQSFGIMDYSLLVGIHNLEREKNNSAIEAYFDAKLQEPMPTKATEGLTPIVKSVQKYDKVFNITAVPARSAKGDRLLLYLGIIDILQSYKIKKKLEHAFKSLYTDGKNISVCDPKFYENRFIEFMSQKVFRKNTLKSSPTRKRLTFKDSKKGDEPASPDQMNSIIMRNSSIKTPVIPLPSRLNSSTTSSSYRESSLRNIKPIDSVESMSGILSDLPRPQTDTPTRNSGRVVIIKSKNKFDEIHEGDGDSLKETEARREPITPVLDMNSKVSPYSINSNRTPNTAEFKPNYNAANKTATTNVNNSCNSNNSRTNTLYTTIDKFSNDNDYTSNIKPLSTDLCKPTTSSYWNTSPLMKPSNNQYSASKAEQPTTNQNFNDKKLSEKSASQIVASNQSEQEEVCNNDVETSRPSNFKIKSVRVTSFRSATFDQSQTVTGNGRAMTCSRTYTVKNEMSAAKVLINKENMKMFSTSLSSSISSSIVSSMSSSLVSVKHQGFNSEFHS